MSKALQENIYCTKNMMYAFFSILILIMLMTRVIENLPLDITLLLEKIL